jgi:hypothetical protein
MDIEVSSIVVILSLNGLIIFTLIIYLLFFYKWDKRTYEDLVENLDNFGRELQGNALYMEEEASNIESLLAKDDTSSVGGYYGAGTGARDNIINTNKRSIDLTSIASKNYGN